MTAWCAMVVAASACVLQESPASAPVAVILDADSPVADAAAAARVREQALEEVERHAHPRYYELRAASMASIPEDMRDSFRHVSFTFQRPTYSGVSLDVVEAAEILRKNEAVRDTVIRRECSRPIADCGGVVHAAASVLVADTEAASARKLQEVAETASRQGAGTLVIVTAGWPYRDEGRLGLDRDVETLRAGATRLVILRVPSAVRFGGAVKDASETLAARLSAPIITLTSADDVLRARELLAAHVSPPPLTASAFGPTEPIGLALQEWPPGSPESVDALLQRAIAYVARFERTFSSVIWRERYQQEDRTRLRFSASGGSFWKVAGRRTLDSELLFVWLPADKSWIAVRDVMAIDGKTRPPGSRKLPSISTSPTVSVSQLRQLAGENGRFNVGGIVHTFNEPTLALLFLDEYYRRRFAIARRGEQPVAGRRAVAYEFIERARPTVIRNGESDVPVRGTFWLDADTGQVLRAVLEISDATARLRGTMTVEYGSHDRFDVLVPLEMRETYSSADEQVTTVATYSDFRRFETAGRLILPK